MKINREGFPTIRNVALPLILILVALTYCALRYSWSWWVVGPIDAGLLYLIVTIFWFFREPKRPLLQEEGAVFSPADGKVVVIEEVEEKEYFGDRRIQISVFMSVTNVHINWFPVGGKVVYKEYHPGKFLVAMHPKSSDDNERMTVGVETAKGITVIFRQVAGLIARRIVSYAKVGDQATQNFKSGFIKFGSRVDIYLPLDSEILVGLNQKVVGSQTPIARLK